MPATDGVSALLAAHVRPGMVALDVGANEGVVTATLARLVGAGGRVFAYEPFPDSAAAIAARHAADAHVSVIQAAVGDETSEATLYLDAERTSRHSLWAAAPIAPGGTVRVPLVRLDDGLPRLPPVDVVKIDAQGAEGRIVSGAMDLLARDRPLLIFELWLKGLKVSKTDAHGLLDGLARLGYHFHTLNGKGVLRSDGRVHNLLASQSPNASLNVVAHPPSWPAERWRALAAPASCVIPPSPDAPCRPWTRREVRRSP